MGYATVEDLKRVKVPTVDVTVGELTFKIGALTRVQVKWIQESVGYETDEAGEFVLDEDGNREIVDAEKADLLMLACSVMEPALDPENDDHLELLRGLPIGHVADLVNQMMILSGLREEDPT